MCSIRRSSIFACISIVSSWSFPIPRSSPRPLPFALQLVLRRRNGSSVSMSLQNIHLRTIFPGDHRCRSAEPNDELYQKYLLTCHHLRLKHAFASQWLDSSPRLSLSLSLPFLADGPSTEMFEGKNSLSILFHKCLYMNDRDLTEYLPLLPLPSSEKISSLSLFPFQLVDARGLGVERWGSPSLRRDVGRSPRPLPLHSSSPVDPGRHRSTSEFLLFVVPVSPLSIHFAGLLLLPLQSSSSIR